MSFIDALNEGDYNKFRRIYERNPQELLNYPDILITAVNYSYTHKSTDYNYSGILRIIEFLTHLNEVEVDYQDKSGNTALMKSASYCNQDIVRILLEAGANPDLENNKGKSFRDINNNLCGDDTKYIKDENAKYGFRRSRKTSSKSLRKSQRKSRKTSSKSLRKSQRRSRKTSSKSLLKSQRKSRKVQRKSLRKSQRRSRKTSSKSLLKSQRKSRKTSNKSLRKSQRKSRKTSNKSSRKVYRKSLKKNRHKFIS
jgi:ankyrin repeat protein